MRRMLVQIYLSGDWRNHERVEYYFQSPGKDNTMDEGSLRQVIAYGVVQCLASAKLHVYPRHRWVGFDRSLDQLGILESAHGILRSAYRRFISTFPAKRLPVPEAGGSGASGSGAPLTIEDQDGDDSADAAQEDAAMQPGMAAQFPEESWQQQNERHRQKASEWLQASPHVETHRAAPSLRAFQGDAVCADPHLGSDTWEVEQAAAEARRLAGGMCPAAPSASSPPHCTL